MKNILITLGCSLTEGWGCYDVSLLQDNEVFELGKFNLNRHHNRFHEMGWPNRVGKKLGYDRVINLGQSGAGNGYTIRNFMDTIDVSEFKDSKVSVIWLLQEPHRLDRYYNEKLAIIGTPFDKRDEWMTTYHISCLSSPTFEMDSWMESIFYINIFNEVCSNRGWDSVVINYIKPPDKIISKVKKLNVLHIDGLLNDLSIAMCGHPDELGYEVISNRMVSELENTKFPKFPKKQKVEWEHRLHEYKFKTQ